MSIRLPDDRTAECPHCGTFAYLRPIHIDAESPLFRALSEHHLQLSAENCPGCRHVILHLVARKYHGPMMGDPDVERIEIWPRGRNLGLSEHIPAAVRGDIQEAVAVEPLSTRAAAALARRALQSALRAASFEHPSKKLSKELALALADSRTPTSLHQVLTVVREAGNDAAHPNEDEAGQIVDVPRDLVPVLITAVREFCDAYFVRPKTIAAVLEPWMEKKGRS